MPSEMTLAHSLLTAPAAHRDLASRKERDEVPLKHWLEKCIDSAVLVVLHGFQQLLHELYLVLLGPGGEIVHADITLF